jgi:CBS domain-containing membrane protein
MPESRREGLRQALVTRFSPDVGDAVYTFVAGGVAIAVSGLVAWLLKQPLLFPSLGPTVYLFFDSPTAPEASPRNTIIGHGVAIVIGFVSLCLFGLQSAPSILHAGVSPARVAAAALSVALSGAILHLVKAKHPPCGATTLIVSLGLLKTPEQLAMIAAGVLLLTTISWIINRACGSRMPFWAAKE